MSSSIKKSTSSRRRTQEAGHFVRETPGSQSLERGLRILRAFRLGNPVLTNAEIAERVGLPRPTVSRLTRSLVDSGFLAFDVLQRAYRLSPVHLSMARVYRDDLPVLDLALPLMRAIAEEDGINVGLAVADQCEMVYLASVRKSLHGLARRILPGSRIPIEVTALGQSHLYALDDASRNLLIAQISTRYGDDWPKVRLQLQRATKALKTNGFCVADWQPGMVAISTPLRLPENSIYALNVSFSTTAGKSRAVQIEHYGPRLLKLASDIGMAWHSWDQERSISD